MVIGDPHPDQFGEDRGTKVKKRKQEFSRKRPGTLLMMYSHRNTNEIASNNRTTYLEDIFRGRRGRKDTGFLCTASFFDLLTPCLVLCCIHSVLVNFVRYTLQLTFAMR